MAPEDRIFDLLNKLGLDQKDLAERLGISPDVVSLWKRGKSTSYRRYIEKIAEVLKTTVEYLLTGKEKEPTAPKDGEPVNTITFNRNGKVVRKQYSKEKWDTIIKMLDAIPEDRLP